VKRGMPIAGCPQRGSATDRHSNEGSAGRNGKHGRRRHRGRQARSMTSPSRRMRAGRTRSRETNASSATVPSFGLAYTATRVRSQKENPSFSNSPWIRGAPQRQFSVAMRPMRLRSCESMRSRPGRRREHLQNPRNPSRCQPRWPTVAGWTSTRASLHRGHNRRKHSQSRRSDRRKRRSERTRTPS
jgi:hypothetical protein